MSYGSSPLNVPSGFGEIETSRRGGGESYPSCEALQNMASS